MIDHAAVRRPNGMEMYNVWAFGYGLRAFATLLPSIEDPKLMDTLRERGIGIEANLTSNVQTSTVPDYASHPLKRYLEAGLLATLNTDDPGISAIDLPYEYNVAAPLAGLSLEQIHQAQRNAFALAFLNADERAALLARKAEDQGRP